MRTLTPEQKVVADAYNAATPQEQHRMDTQLARLKAQAVASPHALFHLFPTLGAKTLKLKNAVPAPAPSADTTGESP